ncbi:hypothetical protein AURDEDRAFT_108060, partial [Auricularia subglabra TFB-10046 SS5]
MRVATPPLYETVIIRSTAQAHALARALQNEEDFGRYIKKIRFEGAYADSVSKIVSKAPNITDFCFTLTVWSDASVRGLTRALRMVNPARVILTLAPAKAIKNVKHAELLAQLCSSIPTWSNLRIFCFPSSDSRTRRYVRMTEDEINPGIVTALAASQTLEYVSLWRPYFGQTVPEPITVLGSSSSIKRINWHYGLYPPEPPSSLLAALGPSLRSRIEFIRPTTGSKIAPHAPSHPAEADTSL